jgi:hypothetical protein
MDTDTVVRKVHIEVSDDGRSLYFYTNFPVYLYKDDMGWTLNAEWNHAESLVGKAWRAKYGSHGCNFMMGLLALHPAYYCISDHQVTAHLRGPWDIRVATKEVGAMFREYFPGVKIYKAPITKRVAQWFYRNWRRPLFTGK